MLDHIRCRNANKRVTVWKSNREFKVNDVLVWLQRANNDPFMLAMLAIGGIAFVTLVLSIRFGFRKLFTVHASRRKERDALAGCWASEADLMSPEFELLKPVKRKWAIWNFRR